MAEERRESRFGGDDDPIAEAFEKLQRRSPIAQGATLPFGQSNEQRSHLNPAQQENFNRLAKYFDPKSDEGFPLTRLGAMAAGPNPVERWTTRLNLLGVTAVGGKKGDTAPGLLGEMFKEAGWNPETVPKGEIAVGPQFDEDVNLTLEHELMHRAIQEYFPDLGGSDSEVFIRLITDEPEDRRWLVANFGKEAPEIFKRMFGGKIQEIEKAAKAKIKELRAKK